MKIYLKNEREEYNARREAVCTELNITKNQYNWLRRNGECLHNIYENACNGFLTEEAEEKATDRLYAEIDTKAKILGLHIFYQTDPRGATIYASKNAIERNNYNRSGCYCIY